MVYLPRYEWKRRSRQPNRMCQKNNSHNHSEPGDCQPNVNRTVEAKRTTASKQTKRTTAGRRPGPAEPHHLPPYLRITQLPHQHRTSFIPPVEANTVGIVPSASLTTLRHSNAPITSAIHHPPIPISTGRSSQGPTIPDTVQPKTNRVQPIAVVSSIPSRPPITTRLPPNSLPLPPPPVG